MPRRHRDLHQPPRHDRGLHQHAKDSTVWQPRAADPELETEFLRRLMVKLGVHARAIQGAGGQRALRPPAPRMTTVNNVPVVQMDEGFDRAWRRVGLALDRTGFTVEDRNRNDGHVLRALCGEPEPDKKSPASSASCSADRRQSAPLKYRIAVRSQGEPPRCPCSMSATGARSVRQRQAHPARDRDDLK
jgi:outer membrane protein assembly factor BamC